MLSLLSDGLLAFNAWQLILTLFILTHITIVSVTVYLHRYSAHRALELHPAVQHFFRFWLWLTTGMTTKAWTAIHRKHHAKCETPDDPHSPQTRGIREVLWRGSELYRAEAENAETLSQYGQGTPDDWLENHLYTPHSALGIVLMLALDVLLFGAIGITVWAIQMIWIPFFAAGIINGIGHYWGYRNFECGDASRNISPIGILIGGEELHNNHHTFPNSAKLSIKPWEFDIGWFWIRLLSALKLARVKKVAPQLWQEKGKTMIDRETLSAILTNRFQVLAQYQKNVIAPVIRQEKEKASAASRRLYGRARKLLVRERNLIDEKTAQRLEALLSESSTLQTIYEFRLRLQDIWNRTSSNSNDMVEKLADWVAEAEATGIQALQDFAATVRTYTVKPAAVPVGY